jgi:hypothetical protein
MDTVKPLISPTSNITVFRTPPGCSAVVNYPVPTFTDNCPSCAPAVPSSYIYLGSFGGHSYYKSPTSDDWNNFEGFASGLGGYLATINSAAENAFLAAAVSGPAWIGFTDRTTEGTFRWSNGEPVTYTGWCSGAPRGAASTSQDYTAINGGAGGCWEDYYSCCLPAIIEFNCSPFTERIAGPASGSSFPVGTTTVTYRATDMAGNMATRSFTVTVVDTTNTCAGTNSRLVPGNSNGAYEVKVYPNPNNGSFIVELPYLVDDKAQTQITVTDAQGKLITRRIVTGKDGNKIGFNLSNIARGMYFVEVVQGNQRHRAMLVVN